MSEDSFTYFSRGVRKQVSSEAKRRITDQYTDWETFLDNFSLIINNFPSIEGLDEQEAALLLSAMNASKHSLERARNITESAILQMKDIVTNGIFDPFGEEDEPDLDSPNEDNETDR